MNSRAYITPMVETSQVKVERFSGGIGVAVFGCRRFHGWSMCEHFRILAVVETGQVHLEWITGCIEAAEKITIMRFD